MGRVLQYPDGGLNVPMSIQKIINEVPPAENPKRVALDSLKFKHARQLPKIIKAQEFDHENLKTIQIMKQIDNTLRIKKLMADQELIHTFNPLSSNTVEQFSHELAKKYEAPSDPEAFLLTEDL